MKASTAIRATRAATLAKGEARNAWLNAERDGNPHVEALKLVYWRRIRQFWAFLGYAQWRATEMEQEQEQGHEL